MAKQGRWSIKQFLFAGSAAILVLIIVNVLLTQYVFEAKADLLKIETKVLESAKTLLMIRRNEKDFISRFEAKYIKQVEQQNKLLVEQLVVIDQLLNRSSLEVSFNSQQAINELNNYQAAFRHLSDEIYRLHGTSTRLGLLQQFERNAKQLQLLINKANQPNIFNLIIINQSTIFDYFNSFEDELLLKINREFSELELLFKQTVSFNQSLQQAFNVYRLSFFSLQQSMQKRGYTEQLGYHGALRENAHNVENNLKALFETVPVKVEKSIAALVLLQAISEALLVLFIIAILVYVYVSIAKMEAGLINARQKEQRANRAKSAFLANMSHEIRTPLNGIIGMTEILNDSKLSAPQKDYLSTINSSSQTLLMLINDILDLSKIESGHLEICPHTCAVKEVIYDTAALIAPKAQQKNICIDIVIDECIPNYIRADEQKLRQVLMNLASNAIKFTASGQVLFSMKSQLQTANSIKILFSVKDTGVGIEADKHQHIFEEFKQEAANTAVNFGGTGLGLSISSKIVSMMGGEIGLNSTKGEGSEFYFSLVFDIKTTEVHLVAKRSTQVVYSALAPSPLLIQNLTGFGYPLSVVCSTNDIEIELSQSAVIILHAEDVVDMTMLAKIAARYNKVPILIARANHCDKKEFGDLVAGYITLPLLGGRLDNLLQSVTQQFAREPSGVDNNSELGISSAAQQSKMVLVVEDNKVNQKVVSLNLDKLNLAYVIANDGQEALEQYKKHQGQFSVILMDCMMPVMDGFEATKAIRNFERQAATQAVPIIALTASILDDDIQKCFDSGMDDYLPKPFKREVLVDKLAKLH